MSYPKKNYTIKMYTDNTKTTKLKKDFKGWGKQNKFCLKANYIDHSHARNICSAKLWGQITESRAGYEELPELLRTSPNNGAIDGFPIKVYYNNSYEGVYTLNIPKDKWMFNMDDDLENHAVLCGEEYNSGCFRTVNASVWSDEIHDVMPQSIKTSFENFQRFVINSTDEEFKANIENYAYLDSLIDYYIFQYAICGLDSMGKNQLFATYDGTKWIATSYDMDSTFGLYWNGQSYVSATYRMQQDYESGKNTGGQGNVLYNKIEKLYPNEIKARYNELRAGALSYTNVVNVFEPFMDIIGKDLYAEDLTIYTGIPSGNTNNITQIRNYFRDRLVYVDAQIAGLQEPTPSTPCTSIRLDKSDIILGHDEGVKVNLLEGLEYEINATNGNDATYNIQLESGRYCLRNINEGVYKWLACKRLVGNDVVTGQDKTDGIVFDIETKGTYKIVFNIGSETSVNLNKIELCKWNDVEEGEALEFTQAGKGWFNPSMNIQEEGTSTNDVYSDEVVVNPSKTYILRDTTENRNYGSSTYSENGPCLIVTNSEGVSSYVKPTYAHGILIENCSKIKFSINKNYHREINAFQIVEVEKESVSGKILSAKLTATVTPANTTDVIKWSVNPTGICAVNNGIITAKKNGECVVKATCGTQSATCNVTVRGIEEVVSAIEYELESPLVCDGTSDFIDTGVALCKEDIDYTILLDVTPDTISVGDRGAILHCMHEVSPYAGIVIQNSPPDVNFSISSGSNTGRFANIIPIETRTRIGIVRQRDTFKVITSNGTNSCSYTFTSISQNLLLGAYQDTAGNKGRFFKGTIHDFRVYNEVISDEDINRYIENGTLDSNVVFRVDSTCLDMNTNTLTDNVAGLTATLTGTPTKNDDGIVFDTSSTFIFDIQQLNLNDFTLRVKFKPTTLDGLFRNVFVLGNSRATACYGTSYTSYVGSAQTRVKFGTSNTITNHTVGNTISSTSIISAVPSDTECELVLSVSADNNIRVFKNGELVQNGQVPTERNRFFLGNYEGNNRFIGSYSLIELYDKFCDTYEDLTQ